MAGADLDGNKFCFGATLAELRPASLPGFFPSLDGLDAARLGLGRSAPAGSDAVATSRATLRAALLSELADAVLVFAALDCDDVL